MPKGWKWSGSPYWKGLELVKGNITTDNISLNKLINIPIGNINFI